MRQSDCAVARPEANTPTAASGYRNRRFTMHLLWVDDGGSAPKLGAPPCAPSSGAKQFLTCVSAPQELGHGLPVVVVIADRLDDREDRNREEHAPEIPDPSEEEQADERCRRVHARAAAREPGREDEADQGRDQDGAARDEECNRPFAELQEARDEARGGADP